MEVWSFNMTAMQQSHFSLTYNYGHLYNLVWRENTGTERTRRGWRKLADLRKGGEIFMNYKGLQEKVHRFSKPTEKMGNVYSLSLYS